MRKHSKKRNSLLVYEFLVRTISKSLIDDDKRKSSAALKILRRHFKPGTEIYKEFRIMNALAKTTVSSEHTAASILKEAKSAIQGLDEQKLDREKSLLIRNINHTINSEDFYDHHIPQYREYATLGVLFAEWKSKNKDLESLAQYEDTVMKSLVTEKINESDAYISEDTSGTARLLMKVMTKKLNEKYSGVLNEQQRSLIKSYAYSTASDDQTSIRMKLEEVRKNLVNLINEYSSSLNNDFLKEKLEQTKLGLMQEDLETIDDSTVTRFMLYSRLNDELETKE